MTKMKQKVDRDTWIQGALINDLLIATGFYSNSRLDREHLCSILTKIKKTEGFRVDLKCREIFSIQGLDYEYQPEHIKIVQEGTDFYVRVFKYKYGELYSVYSPNL